MKLNYARRCINPPMKMGLAGYFNTRIWESVLDDLEVRAAFFQNGSQKAFLIQYDLIVCPPELFQMLKSALNEAGFGDAVLLVTATHCHTAPEVRRGRGGFNAEYLPFAVERTVAACREAAANPEEARMSGNTVIENTCAFNRRFWMKDGTVQTNPGKLNPEIVRPEGDVDPEIPMLCFETAGGRKLLLCSICNHADTTGGNLVSGDWPGWTRRLTEEVLGKGSMVFPLIGCSGDINHFDVSRPGDQTCPEEAESIGRRYAGAVIGGLPGLQEIPADFSCRMLPLDMPGRELTQAEIDEARMTMEKYADLEFDANTVKNLTAEDFARKSPVVLKYFAQNLLNLVEHPKSFHFEVSLLDFGSGAVIGLPCEPFVTSGLLIRHAMFFGRTALAAILNNGSGTGYIPNSWSYSRGGYENTPRSSPFSVHGMELLLETVKQIISKKD